MAKSKGIRPPKGSTPLERLLWFTAVGAPDECWPCRCGITPKGYAMLGVEGRRVYAHRLSYELHHGPIPAGTIVRHRCDNPPCVNPAHLRTGTHADNTADMVVQGRHRAPCPDCGRLIGRGNMVRHRRTHPPRGADLSTREPSLCE